MKNYKHTLFHLFLLLSIYGNLSYADEVPNAPALTEFGTKPVVAGETICTNNNQQGVSQPAVLIKGSAQAGTLITIYKDGTAFTQSVPTQIITASDGKWSATVTIDTGEFNITAIASNQAGESLHSEPVHVILDTTPPVITVVVRQTGWRTNQLYMYGQNNMYGRISDSQAGVNWQTANISVKDLTDNEQIAGTQEHDATVQIDFYPTDGWGVTRENTHRYRITVNASDMAGNSASNYREYIYDSVYPSAAVITHVYDEGTWRPYTSGMTVHTNPPKLKGSVWPVNYKDQGPEAYAIFDNRFYRWNRTYFTTNNGKININNGEFIHEWTPDQVFQEGTTNINLYTVDSANLPKLTTVTLNFSYGTPAPVSIPSSPDLSSLYEVHGGERKVVGSPLIPDFSGTANSVSSVQTIRIFKAPQQGNDWTKNGYNYSVEIIPSGQQYPNTAGVYDPGEVYSDSNDNDRYDLGEPFLDDNSKGISDGTSYSIPNFLGYEFGQGTMYLKIAAVNQYGGSSATSLGRFHYMTTPPDIQSVEMQPATASYLAMSQRPTSITVYVQNYGADWAIYFYGIDETVSKIEVLDDNNNVVSTNETTWTYLQSLRYTGTIDVSNVNFQPQKLYTIRVTARDLMTNQSVENMYSFAIDTLAPQIVDIIPEPGSEIGRLPNFQATLFDTSSEGLNGSGISFGNGDQAIGDTSYSQLRPFRVIDTATASGNVLVIQSPLTGYDGSNLAVNGQEFEIWRANDSDTVGTVAITSISGSNITLTPVGISLNNGTQYTILEPIPYYHANNALDTLSANPINQITESGLYAVQVQAVDKVGNMSVVSSVYEFGDEEPIEYNPPTGTFTMSVDKTVAMAGETVTVESEVITTLNGTPVSDGTLVTVSTTFGNIITPDQDQFTVGIQVTTSQGKISFQVHSTANGSGSVHAEVAEAYSAPDPTIEYIPNYPYGTYTLQATPNSLTADGSGTVTVTGPAVTDQYGNIITDTNTPYNLFNVTVPGFTINTPDADVMQGHQIKPQADGTLIINLQAGTVAQTTQFSLESVSQAGTPPVPTASGYISITLVPGAPANTIILSATDDTLIAKSTQTTLITSQPITDQYNNIVSDGTLITVSIAGHGSIISTDEDADQTNGIQRVTNAGIITFQVSAQNASVGDGSVTAQSITGSANGNLTIHFLPDLPTGTITLTPLPAELTADGTSVSVISSDIIRDQYDNSVGSGVTVRISTTTGMVRAGSQSSWSSGPIDVPTLTDGSVQFELQSTLIVEQAQVSVQTLTGSAEGGCNVDFIPGLPAGQISLNTNRNQVIAGSTETIIITGNVKDAYDHPVANNTEITLSVTAGTILTTDVNVAEPGIQVKTTNGSFTFRYTPEGAPVGDCTVTAVSVEGDASGQIIIGFIPGPPDQPFSLYVVPESILADGQSVSTVTSSIISDTYNNIVAEGEYIRIAVDAGNITTPDADPTTPEHEVEVDNTGKIIFEVRSSIQSGTAHITAQSVSGNATGTADLIFHPGIPAQPITLTATPGELVANSGQTSQIVSGIIRDANNNIVSDGTQITITTDRGEISAQDNDGNPKNGIQVVTVGGVISFELLSVLSSAERVETGTALVAAYGEGVPGDRAEGSTSVTFIHGDPYQPIVLSAATSPLTADGQDYTIITSDPILDQYNNPMDAGVLVTVSTDLGEISEDDATGIPGNQVTTDAAGRISFTLRTGTQSGSATITALSYVGTSQGQLIVPFEAGAPSGSIILHSNPSEVELDGVSTATITSDPITDVFGNIVSDGTQITVNTDNGFIDSSDQNVSIAGIQVTTVNGVISFILSSQGGTRGSATIEAESIDKNATGSIEVFFIPGSPSGTVILTPLPASIVADPNGLAPVQGVITESTITSDIITDASGNVIANNELFTVYTNRGLITSPDAQPSLGGVQIASAGGSISFELSSYGSAIGIATVYIQSVNGTASGSTQVVFSDTGITDTIKIVLDTDRPDSDRYVAWDTSRQVTVICKDRMGNPAVGDSVTLKMIQNESLASLSQYAGYAGSGDGSYFTGQTDSAGILLVTYTTPPYTGQADDAEDILDAETVLVPDTEVDNRRFIVTTNVPPLFRFYSMLPETKAGDYHPFTIEVIDQYDSHITDVQSQFPSLQVVFNSQPPSHESCGNFYTYDNDTGSYILIGQNTPVPLTWDTDGYATVYYRDTLAGTTTLSVYDEQDDGIKTASKDLTVLPADVSVFSISASPLEILADGNSVSTITSSVITDSFGNIIEGLIVTVNTNYGTLIAVDIDGDGNNGVQVATGSTGRFSFSLRSDISVVTATVNASTFSGNNSDSVYVDFVAGSPYGTVTLFPDQTEIAADPANSTTIHSSVIRDQWGNQVAQGELITVSTNLGEIITADADSNGSNGIQIAVDPQGKISFDLQASVLAGTATINVSSINGSATGSTSIDFVPGSPAGTITLHATPSQVIANGPNSCAITSDPITDGTNIVRDGELFTISTDYGTVVALDEGTQPGIQVKSSNGVISFLFNPNADKGTATIQAVSINGTASGSVAITLISEARTTGTIPLTATPAEILADGTTESTVISDTLYDRYGNILDQGISFNVSTTNGTVNETGLQSINVATDDSGIIQFEIKSSTTAGLAEVTVQCINNPASTGTENIRFLPGTAAGAITLQAVPAQLTANSNQTSIIKVPSVMS